MYAPGTHRRKAFSARAMHEQAMSDQSTAQFPARNPLVVPVLEPAAQEFVTATANPPYLFDLGPR